MVLHLHASFFKAVREGLPLSPSRCHGGRGGIARRDCGRWSRGPSGASPPHPVPRLRSRGRRLTVHSHSEFIRRGRIARCPGSKPFVTRMLHHVNDIVELSSHCFALQVWVDRVLKVSSMTLSREFRWAPFRPQDSISSFSRGRCFYRFAVRFLGSLKK